MNLLQQAIQLLTESPGNIVYHLVTLFAIQVVLAISLTLWRRDRRDQIARRMAWAAGGILLLRLLLLFAGLVYTADPLQAVAVLPLLEQAANSATVLLMVWALAPHAKRLPRLGDVLLLLGLLLVLVMGLSFAPQWQAMAAAGVAYNSTPQATMWGILQLAALIAGLGLALMNSHTRHSLAPMILGLLLLSHLAHLWNYPEIIPTETNITYWIRLGYLAALPLWAVMVYRRSLLSLLVDEHDQQAAPTAAADTLELAAQAIHSLDKPAAVQTLVTMVSDLTDAVFVGVGIFQDEAQQQLFLTSNLPQVTANAPRTWQLNLPDWSAFQTALSQRQAVELVPAGAGAGQLHRLYEAMAIDPLGALLIQPMLARSQPVGLLLLAQANGRHQTTWRDRQIAPALANFAAQVVQNVHAHAQALAATAQPTAPPVERETAVSGRVIALEEERDQLLEKLEVANNRLIQAEMRTATVTKRAHDLAAALEEMERLSHDERVASLEKEIETLRESLIEAEEAMALASAGEGGVSTEWVMMTITRYSGQLEEAQARIEMLEAELARRDQGVVDELFISLVQELRTPMTSIAGYTDLLLGETMGILGVKQRDFLQRVQANIERMGTLLNQLVQLTARQESPAMPADELVDMREVVETAVNGVITQIREKRLHLDLDVADDLPPLLVSRNDLYQILTNLLSNACQASANEGRVAVSARTDAVPGRKNSSSEMIHFLHLAITDSGGGIPAADLGRVFRPSHQADEPLIAGVGDRGAGLSVAQALTVANGGRIWVDSDLSRGGSTFSLLFPISPPEMADEASEQAGNGQVST